MKEDNISLLRGVGEKEIKSYWFKVRRFLPQRLNQRHIFRSGHLVRIAPLF